MPFISNPFIWDVHVISPHLSPGLQNLCQNGSWFKSHLLLSFPHSLPKLSFKPKHSHAVHLLYTLWWLLNTKTIKQNRYMDGFQDIYVGWYKAKEKGICMAQFMLNSKKWGRKNLQWWAGKKGLLRDPVELWGLVDMFSNLIVRIVLPL